MICTSGKGGSKYNTWQNCFGRDGLLNTYQWCKRDRNGQDQGEISFLETSSSLQTLQPQEDLGWWGESWMWEQMQRAWYALCAFGPGPAFWRGLWRSSACCWKQECDTMDFLSLSLPLFLSLSLLLFQVHHKEESELKLMHELSSHRLGGGNSSFDKLK